MRLREIKITWTNNNAIECVLDNWRKSIKNRQVSLPIIYILIDKKVLNIFILSNLNLYDAKYNASVYYMQHIEHDLYRINIKRYLSVWQIIGQRRKRSLLLIVILLKTYSSLRFSVFVIFRLNTYFWNFRKMHPLIAISYLKGKNKIYCTCNIALTPNNLISWCLSYI